MKSLQVVALDLVAGRRRKLSLKMAVRDVCEGEEKIWV